jgi:Mg-chelatase subunit ChlD
MAAIAAAPLASSQSTEFERLFALYRGGSADEAVRSFALWPEARVEAEAALPAGMTDRQALAALALFHTEAGLARLTFGGPTSRIHGTLNLPYVREIHYRNSLALIERLSAEAEASSDAALARFCSDWLIAAHAVVADGGARMVALSLERRPRAFDRSADASTLIGAAEARAMGPLEHDSMYGGSIDVTGKDNPSRMRDTITLGGEMFDAPRSRRAELAFRQALALDAGFVEARLRLGRTLQVLNRRNDAQPELERASRDAAAAGHTFVHQLAELFLGQLLEDAGRPDAASSAYAKALAVDPTAITPRLAQGQVLLTLGETEAGWAMLRTALAEAGVRAPPARDSWAVFPEFTDREPDARWARLRAYVSKTPYSPPARTTRAAGEPATLRGPAAPGAALPALTGDAPVRIDALVTHRGAPVTGLTSRDFYVIDGNARQDIQVVAPGHLSVVIVMDTSASAYRLANERSVSDLAAMVIDALAPGDAVSVVTASHRLALVVDGVVDFAAARALVAQVEPDPRGDTRLWDGMLAARSVVSRATGRPVMVVISDGGDTHSFFSRGRVEDVLARSGMVIDAIQWRGGYGRNCDDCIFEAPRGAIRGGAVSPATGGRGYADDAPDLGTQLAARFASLRQSYVVTYTPANTGPRRPGWREARIALIPGVQGKVEAVGGYYMKN